MGRGGRAAHKVRCPAGAHSGQPGPPSSSPVFEKLQSVERVLEKDGRLRCLSANSHPPLREGCPGGVHAHELLGHTRTRAADPA